MKILFAGDPHWDPTGPGSRVDDYGETCFIKTNFVLRKAEELVVDLIVWAGDTCGEGMENRPFRVRMKTLLKGCKIPQMTLIGNHPGDTTRSKFSSWVTREIGDYVVSGCFTPMVSRYSIPEGGTFLGLNAYQYTKYTLPPDNPEHPVRIIFAHAFIDLPDPDLAFTSSELKAKYPRLEAIFAGHDHQHYGSMKVSDVWVHRPGSLLRTANDKSSNRIPVVGVYDTETKKYDEITVAVALPPEKVFSVEVKNLRVEAAVTLKNFTETLSSMKKTESGVLSIVWDMAEKLDPMSREVVKEDLLTSGLKR
jgi:DNA repair exonuclease SbcCD nuclease subunit